MGLLAAQESGGGAALALNTVCPHCCVAAEEQLTL